MQSRQGPHNAGSQQEIIQCVIMIEDQAMSYSDSDHTMHESQ